jgi:hypothetical protein
MDASKFDFAGLTVANFGDQVGTQGGDVEGDIAFDVSPEFEATDVIDPSVNVIRMVSRT